MSENKSISLVLSSGGARGMAHIGVIEVLEERGYKIREVVGCSAGALVGGIYAAGKLPEFKEWICNLDRIDVFSLMDFTFSSRGFIKGDRVFKALEKVVKDCKIEDLSIPFRCNAVNYSKGKEVVFDAGSLMTAIRASVSIPSVLQPVKYHQQELIDGGIMNPIPLSLVEDGEDHIVLAVGLNGGEADLFKEKITNKTKKSMVKMPSWMKEYTTKLTSFFEEEESEKMESLGSIDLLNRSFDLLQDQLSALVLEIHQPDILVQISRNQAGTLEFYRAGELIEIGRKKAEDALDKWENGNS
ncbi:patatin-like phospholipase family protein [Algoriphagus sp. CAU 1675]|uniref:patatin-like phospholipase family protein n=1 Tax=Algoriphagus sp. CAU 1675 TaxID=3032597 RepID=UPI0023DA97E6|nr:patatin-like phospholipase family protein [Algoriphagus sp. CAU 1675]MDF2156378.1 patatin-like phospholipase family protein [Algoriphagus sp. CAU 1675]